MDTGLIVLKEVKPTEEVKYEEIESTEEVKYEEIESTEEVPETVQKETFPNYSDLYPKIDPIIKEFPKMRWPEFVVKYPELGGISQWSFSARRCCVLKIAGYGYNASGENTRKVERKKRGKYKKRKKVKIENTQELKVTDYAIKKFIKGMFPTTRKGLEYFKIGRALLKKPLATHAELSEEGIVKMSNPSYYKFRREFNKRFQKDKVESDNSGENDKMAQEKITEEKKIPKKIPKKTTVISKSIIHTTLFELEGTFEDEFVEIMDRYTNVINKEFGLNLQMNIQTFPTDKLEVRGHTK